MNMAEHYFPRRKPRNEERCHPNVPESCCEGRRYAVQKGSMFFDWERGGWVDIYNPVRSASWEAVYKTEQNHNGEPYILELCPHCGSELPVLTRRTPAIDCGND